MRLLNTAPVYPSALNDTLLLSEPLPHSARSYRDHVETLRASITHRLCSAWNDQGMAQVEVPFTRCLFEAKTIFRTQTLIHHVSGYRLNTPLRSVFSTRCRFHCRFGAMFTWKEQREEPTLMSDELLQSFSSRSTPSDTSDLISFRGLSHRTGPTGMKL